jgi:hypothetical protein
MFRTGGVRVPISRWGGVGGGGYIGHTTSPPPTPMPCMFFGEALLPLLPSLQSNANHDGWVDTIIAQAHIPPNTH